MLSMMSQRPASPTLMDSVQPLKQPSSQQAQPQPPLGPKPFLVSRSQVDEFYDLLQILDTCLNELQVDYIVVGGTLLGAVRSESFLLTDDGIDLGVIDVDGSYSRMKLNLQQALDRVSSNLIQFHNERGDGSCLDFVQSTRYQNVRINLHILREYTSLADFITVANGESIPEDAFPLHHLDNADAITARPGSYFSKNELYPLKSLQFGPMTVPGPADCVGTLKRVCGDQCFTHYTTSSGEIVELNDDQYAPIQHCSKRIWTDHNRKSLYQTLEYYRQAQPPSRSSGGLSPGGMSRTRSVFKLGGAKTSTVGTSLSTLQPPSPLSSFQAASFTAPPEQAPADSPVLPTKWFGHDVRRHIGELAPEECPDFDQKDLRSVMEPHIAKARRKREDCRNPTLLEVDASIASSVGIPYTALRDERRFLFDEEHSHPLSRILAETLNTDDLSQLHNHAIQDKRLLLEPLMTPQGRARFQECYDHFVTSYCIPLLHSLAITKKEFHSSSILPSTEIAYRYQAFPCLRIVRPGEFSIGPHCDATYGHSIGNLNFHIPLTAVFGTNALYTESHPGREDWHGLTTKSPGLGFLFDGARCLHFSLENTTDVTRVSIDFRIAIYKPNDVSGISGGCPLDLLEDRYSAEPGYYDEACVMMGHLNTHFAGAVAAKKHNRPLLNPDVRNGFPFTKKK